MSAVLGLDIGGAHLKLALLADGRLAAVRQCPCPLWQGLDKLDAALDAGLAGWPADLPAAVTMTGELADLFPDRASGVRGILERAAARLGGAHLAVYRLDGRFVPPAAAIAAPDAVASANWHAAAALAARHAGSGLFLDIGSTTTDIVPLTGGLVAARGSDDASRLAHDELVYSGVVRTPVMALARHVSLGGERRGVIAEYFATLADVYRLTGQLPPEADQQPSADGRGKSPAESRARLARMVGRDAASAADAAWDLLAAELAARHLAALEAACRRVLSGLLPAATAPLVGAGVGRFLASELARRLGRPYLPFAAFVPATPEVAERAADCAPAAAIALLLDEG